MTDFFRLIFWLIFLLIFMFYQDLRERSVKSQDKTSSTTSEKSYITFQSLRNYPSETVALKSALLKTFVWKNCPSKNVQMRINENTDVNAFYLFPTRYGLKLASISSLIFRTFCYLPRNGLSRHLQKNKSGVKLWPKLWHF